MSAPDPTPTNEAAGTSAEPLSPPLMSFTDFRALYEAELRKRQEQRQEQHQQPPAATPGAAAAQVPRPRRGARARAVVAAGADRGVAVFRRIFPNRHVAVRICFAAIIFTGRLSIHSLLTATIAYVAFSLLRYLLSTIRLQVMREGRPARLTGPTPLGSFFIDMAGNGNNAGAAAGQPRHPVQLSFIARMSYITIKCLEALLLSFYPFYSQENLERELRRDGIVGDGIRARQQGAPAPAAAAPAAARAAEAVPGGAPLPPAAEAA